MRRFGRGAALLVAATALALAPPAVESAEDRSEGVLVFFRSPAASEPALGDVAVEVEVFGNLVTEVAFMVDGVERARVDGPPFRTTVGFGNEVGPHRFEAIALADGRPVASAVRETPGLLVNESVDLELMQLYVTVEPQRVEKTSLVKEDFEVRDEGAPQEVVTFEGGDAALTVALLIDSSESMTGGRLDAALAGARAFLAGMNPLDEASVMLFSDLVRSRTAFTQEPSALEAELAGIGAGGGTALNDALFTALSKLERRQGRRVVVLLSDGFDIHSVLDIKDVLWTLRRSRSLVYWIELSDGDAAGIASPWRDSAGHAEERHGLRRLVAESGGRVIPIRRAEDAEGAFAEVLAELRAQYVLGYYPTVNRDDGRWHAVRVKVRKRGYPVRTRGGYVD